MEVEQTSPDPVLEFIMQSGCLLKGGAEEEIGGNCQEKFFSRGTNKHISSKKRRKEGILAFPQTSLTKVFVSLLSSVYTFDVRTECRGKG